MRYLKWNSRIQSLQIVILVFFTRLVTKIEENLVAGSTLINTTLTLSRESVGSLVINTAFEILLVFDYVSDKSVYNRLYWLRPVNHHQITINLDNRRSNAYSDDVVYEKYNKLYVMSGN